MKIAVLSSASAGGAGIAAYRVYKALSDQTDHEVQFFDMASFGEGVSADVSPAITASNSKITNTHFTIDHATISRSWVVELLKDYDAINVHWASYLVSLAELQELAELGKHILFTMHDFYFLTGGCHYPAGCLGYQADCMNCPQVDESKLSKGNVKEALARKKTLFSAPNVHLSAPSAFLTEAAVRAGIVDANRAHVLRNCYGPVYDFTPNATRDERSILLIADSFLEKRKGLALAIDAVKLAAGSLSADERIKLHVVGGLDSEVAHLLYGANVEVITHGHIKEHQALVHIFCQCQFILSASYEDNWPNILVEAGSYGCIPIVGRWHGCEEFVETFELGFKAEKYTPEAYRKAIVAAVDYVREPHANRLGRYVSDVRHMHSAETVAEKYMSVFTSISEQRVEDIEAGDKEHVISHNYLGLETLARDGKGQQPVNGEYMQVSYLPSPFGNQTFQEGQSYTAREIKQMAVVTNGHCYGLANYIVL